MHRLSRNFQIHRRFFGYLLHNLAALLLLVLQHLLEARLVLLVATVSPSLLACARAADLLLTGLWRLPLAHHARKCSLLLVERLRALNASSACILAADIAAALATKGGLQAFCEARVCSLLV